MELLAQVAVPADGGGDVRIILLMFVAGAIGSAGSWVFTRIKEIRQERAARLEAKEKSLLEHKDELIGRLDRERGEAEERAETKAAQLGRCRIAAANRLLHIKYLERILSSAGLSFEKYQEGEEESFSPGGSHVHRAAADPTPPAPKGEGKGDATRP